MKIRETAAVALVASGLIGVAACSTIQGVVSTVTAAEPQIAADIAALCAAVPAVKTAAANTLKGGAANTAASDLSVVQNACNAATADAPTVSAVLAGIEAQVHAASTPSTAPAASN